jgi:hypothetical protein
MAARIFARADFESELAKAGLTKTQFHSSLTIVWKAPNGETITVPVLDSYEEWVLDDVLRKLNLLYRPWHVGPPN